MAGSAAHATRRKRGGAANRSGLGYSELMVSPCADRGRRSSASIPGAGNAGDVRRAAGAGSRGRWTTVPGRRRQSADPGQSIVVGGWAGVGESGDTGLFHRGGSGHPFHQVTVQSARWASRKPSAPQWGGGFFVLIRPISRKRYDAALAAQLKDGVAPLRLRGVRDDAARDCAPD